VDSANNRVGIGTTSPSDTLEVKIGSANTTGVLIHRDNASGGGGIDFSNTSNTVANINAGSGTLTLEADPNNASAGSYISFKTDASEAMRIDSSGNVGIGTTSPAYPLSILSSYKGIEINDGTSTLTIESNTAGQWGNKVSGNNKWEVFTNSARRLTIDGSGNVGIGTSSPNNPQAVNLHISGTSSAIRMSDTTNSLTGNLYASGGEFSVLTSSSHPLVFKTANSERMRIASNGRVGIGTSSPERLLHLQSSAPEIMMKDSDDSSYNTILSNGGTLSITTSAGTLNVEPLGAGAVQLASPTSLGFNIGSGYNYEFDVNGTEAMRIDNNRNVGIGTNSPSSFSSGAYNLVISQPSGSNAGITINNDGANTGSIFFANGTSETAKGRIRYDHSDDHLEISTVDTERMRIDSSGNVFMAKTTDTITTVGHYFGSNGAVNHVRDGVNVMSLGRKSSDGDILSFYKDSTKVGSIGSSAGNYLTIGNNVNTRLRFTASDIRPCDSSGADRDNAIDLGDGVVGARFKDFYLAGNIYLGGTGSANALDDYEEGTWTPTYIGSTTNPSVTYDTTVRYGEYTKIGRKVFITCVVRTDAVASTGSGELRVGGLPFTSSNEFSSATRYGFVVAGATSFNSTPVDLVAYTDVSQNYIRLNEDYGGTSFDTSELKNGANFNSIRISGFYVTTA
jgi:hypothetical protein